MIPIKGNYKFGTDPTMEDQIRRTNNWKTKKIHAWSPFRARGAVDRGVESLWFQKIAVSNPTQAGQRFDRQQLWKAVITGET